MRNKRVVSIILCVLLICFGFGCKNKQNEKTGSDEESYIDYASPEELYDRAENVYIGKLVKTGKEEALPSDNLYISLDFQHITVEVQKVYKGDFKENTLVEDLVTLSYKDFLEEGSTYVFMTHKPFSYDDTNFYIGNIYEAVKIVNETEIEIFNSERYIENGKAKMKYMDDPPRDLKELIVKISKGVLKYNYRLEDVYDFAENVYIGKVVEFGETEMVQTYYDSSLNFQHITVEVQQVYKGDFKENTLVEDMIQSVYDYVFQSNGTYLFMTRKDYSKDSPLFSINNPYEVVRFGKDNKIETIQIDRGLLFREGDSLPADLDELLSRLEKCRS